LHELGTNIHIPASLLVYLFGLLFIKN